MGYFICMKNTITIVLFALTIGVFAGAFPSYSSASSYRYSYTQSNRTQFSYSNFSTDNNGCIFGGIAGSLTCGYRYNFSPFIYSSQTQQPQYSYSTGHDIYTTGGIAGAIVQGFE